MLDESVRDSEAQQMLVEGWMIPLLTHLPSTTVRYTCHENTAAITLNNHPLQLTLSPTLRLPWQISSQ